MPVSGRRGLDAFCERLADDPRAVGTWRDETDVQVFAERMVEAGRAAGYEFSSAEVTALLDSRRRAWWEIALD